MIKIDHNVPIPAILDGRAKYPWDDMKAGDSFVVPMRAGGLKATRIHGHLLISRRVKAHPQERDCYLTGVHDGNVRIWRVKEAP